MNSAQVKIAIADDHCMVRQALISTIPRYGNFAFILEADNGQDLLNQLKNNIPDVLLLDVKMPILDGISTLKIISEKYPSVRILMLSAFQDEVYVSQCLEFGINGFLCKSMDIREIVKAILLANENKVYITNILNDSILKKYLVANHKDKTNLLPDFTPEEIRLIELLTLEKTTEEISEILFLSKRTIEVKREKIKEKAKVKTIGGLLLYCLKRGIIN